jgi:hypothetical protein
MSFSMRPRLMVLTDICNEPDDEMSLIRLLVFANEYDLEGLVATTSVWLRDRTVPERIHSTIDAYGEVLPVLSQHAPGFPTAEYLHSLVAAGHAGFGRAAYAGQPLSTGAARLLQAADRDDPRPLWVTLWGGGNVLAEALEHAQSTRSAEALEQLVGKLRVYSISDQDDAGSYLRATFPGLFYIVSPSTIDEKDYHRATWTGIAGDRWYKNAPGADFTTVSDAWLAANIQSKGPLGALYPNVAYIMEGDTPSYLGLIDNGMASWESPAWGGWGGRYRLRQPLGETRAIWTNDRDTVIGSDGQEYTSDQATIWRWREAFQNAFAARMDWTIMPPEQANHPPMVTVNGIPGTEVIRVTAQPGERLALSAAGTADPDGDVLRYQWFAYPEAGTYTGTVSIATPDGIETTVQLSETGTGELHLLLAVTDSGTPPLTSYRRVIVEIAS